MFSVIIQRLLILVILVFFVSMPAFGEDSLPGLQTEQLPSLSSQPLAVISPTDTTYSVECFLGNPNQKENLGSVTVTTATDAGPVCNALFYACRGGCYGCFTDFDHSDEICVDNAGRKYLR